MNETISLLQAHRSSRSYKSNAIPGEILDAIIESAHRAPTSINSQQISLVVVRDAASRARIAEIAGSQSWIAPVSYTHLWCQPAGPAGKADCSRA